MVGHGSAFAVAGMDRPLCAGSRATPFCRPTVTYSPRSAPGSMLAVRDSAPALPGAGDGVCAIITPSRLPSPASRTGGTPSNWPGLRKLSVAREDLAEAEAALAAGSARPRL